MAGAPAFKKKEVDIEALMAQAAAAEEEAKLEAEKANSKKRKVKKEKVKRDKVKKEKPKREKKKKTKDKSKEKTKDKPKKSKKSKKGKGGNERPKVFGVSLPELGIEPGELPEVFEDLVTCLEGHATETQGLFRKTAPVVEIDKLVDRYHEGEEINWNDIEDKHIVGGVLMAFLLRLPEPIITFSAYDKLMDIVSSDKEREEQLAEIKKVISDLPELNYNLLEYLLDFLDTMTQDADDNLMTSDNLAICFGPGLMRRKEENLGQLMKESGLVTSVVTVLIDQYGFFFRGEGIDEQDSKSVTRSNTDYTAFTTVALNGLKAVSKELGEIVGNLEWEKLWHTSSLAHLSILEDFLSKIINDEVSAIDEEVVRNEISDSLSHYSGEIDRSPISSTCSGLKKKLSGHQSTVEDTAAVLGHQSGERDVVLQAIKVSKYCSALLRIMKPFIEKEMDVSHSDVKDVKELVPGIKKEINQLKVQLSSCENYHFAAVLSRVIRAIQKALKERIKTPIVDVDLSVPTTTPTAKDKMKIENLQDALEFSFPVCIKTLNTILGELDNPDKKSEATRSSDLLAEVDNVLKKFRKLNLSPTLETGPPPASPHPLAQTSSPRPMAPHPSSQKSPPPMAPHPSARQSPRPMAPHPSAQKSTAPPPMAPHPSARQSPRPMAPHPSSQKSPPPMAPHPSTQNARGAPSPMAPHPSTQNAKRAPSPMAAHPSARQSPRPMVPHPSVQKSAPPTAPHPSAQNTRGAPPPVAPHPSTQKSTAPPSIAPHPSTQNARGAPPPVAPHPSTQKSPRTPLPRFDDFDF